MKGALRKLTLYDKLAFVASGLMLLLLLGLGHFHKMGGYGVETDFYWAYAPDAQNILDGKAPQEPGVGPGYALVLAAFNLVFHDWFLSGKLISILSTIVGGFFTFKMISAVFNQRVALFTMILWYVTVLPFAVLAGTDMFFACLVAAGIYYFLRNPSFSKRSLGISAAIMAYAYLTRHNAIVLPIGVALIIAIVNPNSWSWSVRLKAVAVFGAVFFAVIAPWLAVLQFSAGGAVRSDSYLIIASHFYGRPGVVSSEDMRLAAQSFDSLKSVIFYDFGYFVKHYTLNIYRHFSDVLMQSLKFPTFLFLGAGAVLLLPKLNKRQFAFFVFPTLSFLLLCLVHYEPRYYLYIIAFFLLWPVYFLFPGSDQIEKRKQRQKPPILKVAAYYLTVVMVLAFSLKEVKASIEAEPRELLEISKFMRERVGVNESIIARKPHIGFLSNLETKYFPMAKTLGELLQFAANEDADYLIYGEMESERRPELRALLHPNDELPKELEPFYIWEKPRTVIYKLRKYDLGQNLNQQQQ